MPFADTFKLERNSRSVSTYRHKILNTVSPHIDTAVILGDGQSVCLQTLGDFVIDMELGVLDDFLLDDCDIEPDLGVRV